MSCVHTDAVGYDGICKTDSIDAAGVSRKRDAGLGVIDDGTTYALKTGAPHVVGPVEVYDQQNDRVVGDVGALTAGGLERQNRGFLVREQDDDPEAFLPRYFTRGKDGAPSDDVPALTAEMDRGDGHAVVHEPTRAYNVQPGSSTKQIPNALTATETDVAEALTGMGPARRSDRGTLVEEPTMFDASSMHGSEATGTGRPNMAEPGESLALTSRADRYTVFGHDPVDDLPTCPFDPQPDGPRYAAMGDAVTVNVLEWIGAKIVAEVEAHGGLEHVPTEEGASA